MDDLFDRNYGGAVEEIDAYGYGSDDGGGGILEGAFDEDFPDLQAGYNELQNVSIGGTSMGNDRLSMAMKEKDEIYDMSLATALEKWFDSNTVKLYMNVIKKKIKRYWYKNADGLAAVCYMYSQLYPQNNPLLSGRKTADVLTADLLTEYSDETGIRKEDLFRYYVTFAAF